jgi:hypothetical protein
VIAVRPDDRAATGESVEKPVPQHWSSGLATKQRANIVNYNSAPAKFVFYGSAGVMLFAVCPDGSIERGPGFTTTDEMSKKFWDTVERMRPRAL